MIYVTHDQVEAMTLADRIVIMRDGYIEQVGTPDEVFKRPATRFVAGFIGSPPMNIEDATVDGRQAGVHQRRHAAAAAAILPEPGQGWREGDLRPASRRYLPDAAMACIRAMRQAVHEVTLPVSITEPLGNETLVFVEFAGREWVSRMLNPRAPELRRTMKMSFDLSPSASLFRRRPARAWQSEEETEHGPYRKN